MPGMTTQLNLQADKPGSYSGLSAQFSGPGFSDMRFSVHVESAEGFATWIAHTRGQGAVLEGTTFEELARPTRGGGELTYGSVTEDPFQSVTAGRVTTHWSLEEAL
jgi:cytochrome o ubiquinol oxidase subunit 2